METSTIKAENGTVKGTISVKIESKIRPNGGSKNFCFFYFRFFPKAAEEIIRDTCKVLAIKVTDAAVNVDDVHLFKNRYIIYVLK